MSTLPSTRLQSDDSPPPDDHVVSPPPASSSELYRIQAPRLLRSLSDAAKERGSDLVHENLTRLAGARARMAACINRPVAYLSRIASNLLRDRAKTALRRSLASHVPAGDMPLLHPTKSPCSKSATGTSPCPVLESISAEHRRQGLADRRAKIVARV